MKTETTKKPSIIMLKNVRLSYPALHEPKAMQNPDGKPGKLQYQATALLDKKEHKELIANIEKLTERVALEKFGKKVTLKHTPLRDGNEKEDKEGYGDDKMFLTAKNESKPMIIDGKMEPLLKDSARPYGGCYVNMSVELFAYSHPTGGKGVSASLRVVQFAKDGPAFGAGPVDAEADGFTAVDEAEGY